MLWCSLLQVHAHVHVHVHVHVRVWSSSEGCGQANGVTMNISINTVKCKGQLTSILLQ